MGSQLQLGATLLLTGLFLGLEGPKAVLCTAPPRGSKNCIWFFGTFCLFPASVSVFLNTVNRLSSMSSSIFGAGIRFSYFSFSHHHVPRYLQQLLYTAHLALIRRARSTAQGLGQQQHKQMKLCSASCPNAAAARAHSAPSCVPAVLLRAQVKGQVKLHPTFK